LYRRFIRLRRGRLIRNAMIRKSSISAKTLSFFSGSRARSIDFGQFTPMFRFDAARYRNAIS
jgi:hypothetical protein